MTTSEHTRNIIYLMIERHRGTSRSRDYGTFISGFGSGKLYDGFPTIQIQFSDAEALASDGRLFADIYPSRSYQNLFAKIEEGEPVAVASIIAMLKRLRMIARAKPASLHETTLWQVIDHFQQAQDCAVFAAQSALGKIYLDED